MPTPKQKRAFKKVVEEGKSVGQAMREVGYSANTAINPSDLTQSKGWLELMDEHLSDESLAQKHRELLNKRDKDGEIDVQAASKALDMAYKLKGSYQSDKVQAAKVAHDLTKHQGKIIDITNKYEEELKATLLDSNGTKET